MSTIKKTISKEQDKLWNRYGLWLKDLIGFNSDSYFRLINILHNTLFIYDIDRDNNREEDGIELRNDFFNDRFIKLPGPLEKLMNREFPAYWNNRCSVLEMLIALSLRMNDEYVGDIEESITDKIFYDLISNLGLENMDDRSLSDPKNEKKVKSIIKRWLTRRFDYSGNGSIFPIKNPSRDQRTIEIWEQMLEYINEQY